MLFLALHALGAKALLVVAFALTFIYSRLL